MTITSEIGAPLLKNGAKTLWKNRDYLQVYLRSKMPSIRNQDVRFSMSGLIKIQIPDSNNYLLVLSRHITNQLQPVGGAYKRYGSQEQFDKWGYKPDTKRNGLGVDKESYEDLRFFVKGKYCVDVLKWFATRKGRETDSKREFEEELLKTSILSPEIFRSADLRLNPVRNYITKLKWSQHFTCYEILVMDVFELIPNSEQQAALHDLAQKGTNLKKKYAIVSCDDIEQLRYMENEKQLARIGEHTLLLINKTF